jgi:hypothetical protein
MRISKNDFFFYSCWLLSLFAVAGCTSKPQKQVVICSKDFTEQAILAEILAQHIEAKTDITVKQEKNLGGSLCHQSLTAGKIDLYVEYTGTAYANLLKQKPISDPKKVLDYLKQEYPKQFKAEWTNRWDLITVLRLLCGEIRLKHSIYKLSRNLGKLHLTSGLVSAQNLTREKMDFPDWLKLTGLNFEKNRRNCC